MAGLDGVPSMSDEEELNLDDSSSSFPDKSSDSLRLGAVMTSELGTQLEEFIKETSPMPSPVLPPQDPEDPALPEPPTPTAPEVSPGHTDYLVLIEMRVPGCC